MDDPESEFLWRFYQDHITHGRHHETLRATTTTVLLAIAAGILGLLGGTHSLPLQKERLPAKTKAKYSWLYHRRRYPAGALAPAGYEV
jgi:hypothetical protein